MEPIDAHMPTRYEIADFSNELRIQAITDVPLWQRAFGALVVCIAVVGITSQWLRFWALPLALLASAAIFFGYRVHREGLNVTRLECNTSGGGGGRGARRPRTVFTADIAQLRFDVGPFSGNDGLYAVTSSGQVLLLPRLEFQQTTAVIGAIEKKFPGLAEQWRMGKEGQNR
jgi:hypothetical protein